MERGAQRGAKRETLHLDEDTNSLLEELPYTANAIGVQRELAVVH